jgi:predicted ATPase
MDMRVTNLRIILVGGLPGSGKTPLLEQLRREGWEQFDDFQTEAYDNSPRF